MFRVSVVLIALAMMPVKSYGSDVMLFMSVDSPVTGVENIQSLHNVKIMLIDSYRLILDPINEAGKNVGTREESQQAFIKSHVETIDKEALSQSVGDSFKVNAIANKLGIKTFPAVAVRINGGMRIVRFRGRADIAVQKALQ